MTTTANDGVNNYNFGYFRPLCVDSHSYLVKPLPLGCPFTMYHLTPAYYWEIQRVLQSKTVNNPYVLIELKEYGTTKIPARERGRCAPNYSRGFDFTKSAWGEENGGWGAYVKKEIIQVMAKGSVTAIDPKTQPQNLPLIFTRAIGGYPHDWRETAHIYPAMEQFILTVIIDNYTNSSPPSITTPSIDAEVTKK